MKEAGDSSPYIPTLQWVFTTPNGSNNQDYLCTYTLGIEHAGTVKRGKDRDKETNQGQPETRALLEKVEKEMKKTRGVSHPEKFEARDPDRHIETISFCCFLG